MLAGGGRRETLIRAKEQVGRGATFRLPSSPSGILVLVWAQCCTSASLLGEMCRDCAMFGGCQLDGQ
jgi:hypothetical protein